MSRMSEVLLAVQRVAELRDGFWDILDSERDARRYEYLTLLPVLEQYFGAGNVPTLEDEDDDRFDPDITEWLDVPTDEEEARHDELMRDFQDVYGISAHEYHARTVH